MYRLLKWHLHEYTMTSSNGNIFRIAVPLCGEFVGHRWIPLKRPVAQSFYISLIYAWTNGWVSNRDAGDLKRDQADYDVSVMSKTPYKYFLCIRVRTAIPEKRIGWEGWVS